MTHPYPSAARGLVGRLLCALLVLLAGRAAAQSYTVPISGTASITTCSGTLYDDGGANGNFSTNATGSITIVPATAGNKVRLTFSSFATGYYDRLTIYDGTSTTAPAIGTYSYSQSPGTVYATSSSGALTVRFQTDYYTYGYSGFAADIACVTSVPQADLAIQGASVSPVSAVPGNSISLYSTIYNLSGYVASSSTIGYYLSTNATLDGADVLLGSSVGGSLAVGASSSRNSYVTLPTATAPGSYYVLFVADYQNQVSESNETNNVSSTFLNVVTPSVDLVIQQPSVSPTNTAPGNALNLSCAIYNQGNAVSPYSSVGFYLSTNPTLDANDQLLTSAYGGSLTATYGSYRSATTNVPAGTAPGTYYVLFVADYQNVVGESVETNNVSSVPLTVSPPSIDLTVTQAGLSSYSAAAGTTLNASAYLVNQGNTTSPSSNLGYYFSTDGLLSANDVLLNSSTGGPLAPGSGNYPGANLTIPATATPGTYYILFVADYQNAVAESNETNNVRSVSVSVITPSVDLVIQSPYLSVGATTAGSTINANHYLVNQGNTTASSSNVGYYLSTDAALTADDVLLSNTTGGALSANTAVTRFPSLPIPANTPNGRYYVLFVADYQGQVTETNETNNVTALVLNIVAPGVDLVVSQPGISRNAAAAGAQLSAGAYVVNQGNTTAPGSSLGYYLSTNSTLDAADVLLANSTVNGLYPNSSLNVYANLTIPAATAAGSYYVLFVADHQNQVSETIETNNVASLPFTVTAPFNGTIVPATGTATISTCNTVIADNGGDSPYVDNSYGTLVINPGTSGSKVRLTFTMLQVESCCDGVTVYDGPSMNSPVLGSFRSLPAGPLTATNASGTLTVLFYSDGSVIGDGFLATVSCVAVGPPDLIVQTPSASSATVAAGNTISLSGTVRNQGIGDAAASQLGYYLSANTTLDAADVLLGTSAGGSLASGSSVVRGGTFTIPAATPAGSYYVLFVADPQNQTTESNETNNLTSLALTVTAPAPDLVLSQPTLTPASVPAGNNVSATCLLSNVGTAAAATSSVGFYLSVDAVLDASDVLLGSAASPAMGVNSGMTRAAALPIPATTAPGSYYVLYVADHLNSVGEGNETNNVVSRALTVTTGTGVQDQLAGLTLSLYPNPVTAGRFEVRLAGAASVAQPVVLTLYNSLGQPVQQQLLTANRAPAAFGTSALPAGVYLLRLSGEHLSATRRVVVE